MASWTGHNAGSREVEPRKPRRRKRSPSNDRRKLSRAVSRAQQTADEIQGTARRRQSARAAGLAVTAQSATTDLDHLYEDFRGDKRAVYAAGAPEGSEYKGRTWGQDRRRAE